MMDIDGKFDVALIPSNQPMIYVAQSGRPTIALFADETEVARPITFEAWNNRLIVKADAADTELQVFYRANAEARPEVQLVDPRLSELVAFLGHKTTIEKPAPGIGLSYGETIGAIHALWRAGHIKADFKAEQDRIMAAILRQQADDENIVRPEFDPEEGTVDPTDGDLPASDLTGIKPPPAVGGSSVEVPRRGRDTVPR
jgi:hypothetical protein